MTFHAFNLSELEQPVECVVFVGDIAVDTGCCVVLGFYFLNRF